MFVYSLLMGVSPYISLEHRELYSLIEYSILEDGNSSSIFIANQPYTLQEVQLILESHPSYLTYIDNSTYYGEDSIHINIQPAINYINIQDNNSSYGSLDLNGSIAIDNMVLVNEIELDKKLQYDTSFHGKTTKWFMGNFSSSYALLKYQGLEIFGGKISRNMGSLNDYSLIFSNNPYSFHHYGFSATNSRMKYSFYTTRLNDMSISETIDGGALNISYKRYWAYQKFDMQITPSLQISLSEAVLYGGEYQNFVASLINPAHFFFATQMNEDIVSNDVWDVQLVYLPKPKIAIYIDLFADDIIVNNEPG